MSSSRWRAWALPFSVVALAACQAPARVQAEPTPVPAPLSTQLEADLLTVRNARILFAHHSVGRDLLSGVALLSDDGDGAGLRLVSIERSATEPGPLWVDASGGRNGDPASKVEFFAATVRSQAPLQPRLAFMKFCFVDFNPDSDVERIFAGYERTLRALSREHPDITFAHVTVPLTRRPSDVKARLWRLVGRAVWEDESNAKRQAFNQRLLEAYPAHRVFDLARAESTYPDGTREAFEHESGTYYALAPIYTDDGEHLSALGKRRMAAELIHFVARALATSP